MPHLSPERIAALVDEPAAAAEQQHLEQCAHCRADFVAVRRIVAAAATERAHPIAPLVGWQQLAGALRDDGLLRDGRVVGAPPDVRSIASAPSAVARAGWLSARGRQVAGMAAAAVVLVSAGVAGGRLTLRDGGSVAPVSPSMAAVQAVAPVVSMAPAVQFRTPDDARATLHSAEEVYSGALLWLAAHDSALSPRQSIGSDVEVTDYRQRLKVLDAAMETARRALYEAPDDPVMNRYYLAALGAREVTLRRLTTVLPASQQVLEY